MSYLVFAPRRKDRLQYTARQLKKRGLRVLTFPLVEVKPKRLKIPAGVQGVLITSSAALEALPVTALPLYCVGEATAEVACEAGFQVAYTGAGNGAELADYLAETLDPQNLYHPTAKDAEIHWYSTLQAKGFTITPAPAYEKIYTDHFNDEVICCLTENKVSYTLVFSAQAARQLQSLCKTHHLPENTLGTVIAISQRAAAPFIKSNNVRVAQHPNLQEMLNVLEQTTQQN